MLARSDSRCPIGSSAATGTVVVGVAVREVEQVEHRLADAAATAADAHALVAERRARDLPTAVHRSDDVLVGHEHVVEEHLVEQRVAGGLAQRTDVDAGRVQVDHQHRDAVVLRLVGIGAHGGEARGRTARRRWSTPSGR